MKHEYLRKINGSDTWKPREQWGEQWGWEEISAAILEHERLNKESDNLTRFGNVRGIPTKYVEACPQGREAKSVMGQDLHNVYWPKTPEVTFNPPQLNPSVVALGPFTIEPTLAEDIEAYKKARERLLKNLDELKKQVRELEDVLEL